ncbi:hypothetical protein [Burkholderia pseudomallei]|uniref:hypothetical protein n=1 Tax=Burkholderia pseudomallei TaxID=28450 RepID=UPI00065A830B|nr:hypothetical protein [Burkholderia pseudomallei]CRY35248.1 Uncharacterised protein [Burkholderia pseudomallei]
MKVTIQGFIQVDIESLSRGRPQFSFFASDMSKYGYAIVARHEITADVPDDVESKAKELIRLMQEKARIESDAAARSSEFSRRISEIFSASQADDSRSRS